MRKLFATLTVLGVATAAAISVAQPPQPPRGDRPRDGGDAPRRDAGGEVESLLTRIMALDANKDGKIQKDEFDDSRLKPLIERADADKDGVATKEELTATFARETSAQGGRGRGGDRGRGDRGPGERGLGGPSGFGPGPGGGPGGPGGRGFAGPPQPGQVLPPFLAEMLQITDAQQKELDALQKDVDARLAKILTAEQKQRLQEMRERGIRGPGGPGGEGRGPGGNRGPGGGEPPRDGGNRRPSSE